MTLAARLDAAHAKTTPVAKLIDRRFLTSLFIVPFLTISLEALEAPLFSLVGRLAKIRAGRQVKSFTNYGAKTRNGRPNRIEREKTHKMRQILMRFPRFIMNGFPAGPHKVLIELAGVNHQTLDKGVVTFVIPKTDASSRGNAKD